MHGRALIVVIVLLAALQLLDSKDGLTSRQLAYKALRNIKRLKGKFDKKLSALQKEFDRLKNATKKEFKRLYGQMSCPMGYVRYKKHCIQFVMDKKDWRKWADARDYCQNTGANLLYLNSTKKHDFVAKYLKENFDTHVSSVFTSGIFCDNAFVPYSWDPGVQRSSANSEWRWQGKRTPVGSDPADLQWCSTTIPHQNPDGLKFTSCLILSRICQWKWSAGKCEIDRPFVCEKAVNPSLRTCIKC